MQKRNKRLLDYARFKAIKDRGEKPDKKLAEQGEQFIAINETLKEELPKLFALTGKLVEACLNNFVQLQLQWNVIWRRKLSQAIDDCKVPGQISDIVDSFAGDFAFFEAQVLSLGICNGSMLAEAVNLVSFLSPTTTVNGDGTASPRQVSSLDLTKRRTLSISSDRSPMLPQPDFGARNFGVENGLQLAAGALTPLTQESSTRRVRASSAVSSQGPRTPEMPGSYRSCFNGSTPISARPITSISRTITEPSPSLPRSSLDASSVNRLSGEAALVSRPHSGSTYPPSGPSGPPADSASLQPGHDTSQHHSSQIGHDAHQRNSSPSSRFSGFFSSAMPMSDSPPEQAPPEPEGRKEFNVIFLAASVYEFNIDRARKEAGYPYLTYVAGEVSVAVSWWTPMG
jgi:dynamin-binding protein